MAAGGATPRGFGRVYPGPWHTPAVTLWPWQYFFISFDDDWFPDLFNPIWIAAAVMLVAVVVLYNFRTRALHRHRLYTDMWEWLFWTGLIMSILLLAGAVFRFDFIVMLVILGSGLGTMLWVRFLKYPPLFEAYEHQLARQRYLARSRGARPEATIRAKATPRGSRRRRRR